MAAAGRSWRASGSRAWRAVLAFLSFLALVLVARAPDLFYHYRDWDEAAMMAQAWAMTRGQVLYRDVFQIHPPLNMLYFVPFFWTLDPGAVPHAVKAANIVIVALSAALIFRFCAVWLQDRLVASAVATSFIFMTSERFHWSQSAHGEFLTTLPIVASVYLLFGGLPARGRGVAAGALWATAFWTRQAALVDCLFLLAVLVLKGRRDRALLLRHVAVIGAGFTVVTAAILVWLDAQGSVDDALRSLFVTTVGHYVAGSEERWFAEPFRVLGAQFPGFVVTATLGLIAVATGPRIAARARSLLVVSAIWVLSVLCMLSAAGRFYRHYLVQTLAPFAVASTAPLALLWRGIRRPAAVLLMLALTASMARTTSFALRDLAAHNWEPQPVHEARLIADFLRAHTRPDDRIFMYRIIHLDVFYLAQRLSSNGIYMYIDMAVEHMHDPALAQRMTARLLRCPPTAIVTSRDLWFGYDSIDQFLWPWLERDYRLATSIGEMRDYRDVARVGEVEIYLRRPDAPLADCKTDPPAGHHPPLIARPSPRDAWAAPRVHASARTSSRPA